MIHYLSERQILMQEILVRAGCFVAIILMGVLLRRIGFFKREDFTVLSKIVIKITLPASIVYSFSGKEFDPSLLTVILVGLGAGVLYMALAWLLNRKNSKDRQAFEVLNISGYNIGNFTMPFVQSFLGPTGVIAASLCDTGNVFVCLGGSYSVASMIKDNKGFSVRRLAKALVKSIPFDCYVIMTILTLLHISLPAPVVSFAQIIANANAFIPMLMLGIGFQLNASKSQLRQILRILIVRYGVAILLALGVYWLLPFAMEVRQALMIVVFSPFPSAAPPFTEELKGDVGLASAINSISIIISIVCIVSILLLTL